MQKCSESSTKEIGKMNYCAAPWNKKSASTNLHQNPSKLRTNHVQDVRESAHAVVCAFGTFLCALLCTFSCTLLYALPSVHFSVRASGTTWCRRKRGKQGGPGSRSAENGKPRLRCRARLRPPRARRAAQAAARTRFATERAVPGRAQRRSHERQVGRAT